MLGSEALVARHRTETPLGSPFTLSCHVSPPFVLFHTPEFCVAAYSTSGSLGFITTSSTTWPVRSLFGMLHEPPWFTVRDTPSNVPTYARFSSAGSTTRLFSKNSVSRPLVASAQWTPPSMERDTPA